MNNSSHGLEDHILIFTTVSENLQVNALTLYPYDLSACDWQTKTRTRLVWTLRLRRPLLVFVTATFVMSGWFVHVVQSFLSEMYQVVSSYSTFTSKKKVIPLLVKSVKNYVTNWYNLSLFNSSNWLIFNKIYQENQDFSHYFMFAKQNATILQPDINL